MNKNLKAALVVGGVVVAVLAVAFIAQAAGFTNTYGFSRLWQANGYGMPYGMMGRGGYWEGGMMGGYYGGMMGRMTYGYGRMGPQMMQGWNGSLPDYNNMPCNNWNGSGNQQPYMSCPYYNQP